MSHRVSIVDLIQATGLSRATIDRAINGRGGIHPRTQKVIDEALKRLTDGGPTARQDLGASCDIIIRLGRGLTEQLVSAAASEHLEAEILDLNQRSDAEIYKAVESACRSPERPLILTAKRNANLHALLAQARRKGKRVVALVSDLPGEARDAFVGIDNRMAGQTAAFLIGGIFQDRREAVVGVVLGDYAFTCHEDREIGFRSHLREHFPHIRLADAVKGEDSPERTKDAVKSLLRDNPNLTAIYNVAGGNRGLADALLEAGLTCKITVITHEANSITAPLIRDGIIHYVIAQRPEDLLLNAIKAAESSSSSRNGDKLVDFAVYTRYNLPRYSSGL